MIGGQTMLNRDKLFDDIMGISEAVFKNASLGNNRQQPWTRNSFVNKGTVLDAQMKKYPRAESIFKQKDWQIKTVEDLNKEPKVKTLRNVKKGSLITRRGKLIPLFHDDSNPKATDIRALHIQYPGAFFLIASNFNALEGGMGDYENDLAGMNHHPVQGEEAAMATMPATIWRRYFAPNDINFLSHLGGFLRFDTNRLGSPIISGMQPNVTVKLMHDEVGNKLQMGVHQNIVVSSGYNDDGAMVDRGDGIMKPAYNTQFPAVGSEGDVCRVSHLYAAAHDISKYVWWGSNSTAAEKAEHAEIAKAVLDAVYELAVLSAYVNGAGVLVLTMIGTSAFKNELQWVVASLDRIKGLIAASGMQVYIIVRYRHAQTLEDKQKQQQFNVDIRGISDEIKRW